MGARVIVADPIPRRREIAQKLGAEAIDPTNHGPEQVMQMTGGKGADLVVECAGHDASIASVFRLRLPGRPHLHGRHQHRPQDRLQHGPHAAEEPHDPRLHRVTGRVPAAIRFLEKTGIDLSPIQTHKFSLTDAVKGFELGQDPKACIKITLTTGAKH